CQGGERQLAEERLDHALAAQVERLPERYGEPVVLDEGHAAELHLVRTDQRRRLVECVGPPDGDVAVLAVGAERGDVLAVGRQREAGEGREGAELFERGRRRLGGLERAHRGDRRGGEGEEDPFHRLTCLGGPARAYTIGRPAERRAAILADGGPFSACRLCGWRQNDLVTFRKNVRPKKS